MMVELQPIPVDSNGNEIFQAQYIPRQKVSPAADHPSMKAYISTYPPLGQVTEVSQTTSNFTALLEVDEVRANEDWQISLLHSDGGEWKETPMKLLEKESPQPIALQKPNSGDLKMIYFTAPLTIQPPSNFTAKFRSGSSQSWKWVKDHQGLQDGVLTLKSVTNQDTMSTNLEDYVQGLNPVLKSKNYRSQSPGTTLWAVDAPIEASNGEDSTLKDIKFGLPWGLGKYLR
jgi:hypothetical protein